MKTLFTLLLFSIITINVSAQNTEKEEYLIAKIVVKTYGEAYLLYIDYSEASGKNYIAPTDPVYDSSGNKIKFKSESAALNYLAKQSWIMVSVIPEESWTQIKYIFKRKIIPDTAVATKPPTAE